MNQWVVYFDGHCNLCNGFIDFLIRRDRAGRLRFASLQGESAKARLPAEFLGQGSGPRSVVLEAPDGRLYSESAAAIRALMALGGGHILLGLLLAVPRPLRDFVYRWIAANRYVWFGRRDVCRTPSPEERERFLP